MEARHAVQSALRTGTSSTRVTAALLAIRRTTPAASSIVRQQSSSASAAGSSAPTNKTTTQRAAPAKSQPWPVSGSDAAPANWIKPKPTIGGQPQAILSKFGLRNFKLTTARSTPVGNAFTNEARSAMGMANLPSPQRFNVNSFLENHRMRAAAQEWNKRLRPVLGRTVPTTHNVDAAKAFQLLQFLVRRNNVAGDFHRQRFHERGGLKRKRLKSQRWRARFKTSFVFTVKRVQQLVKQGW
ncbi:hypothetical protein MCOR25_005415 [Pyricularia grisea]|uniref:Uncharacterized protein n=1 Tax=Pyricularia grisea TaxID=148305 RepID=A0A6P8APW3_PYRGI|nr:hypothetical protein PgNI_11300 [Pyricularia grisea]KAI6365285.1 hypothetical protein MCOR25_005415 [Pyricularia grisea]TLD04066.1 hypothetical protein PgNI_11300 [Pyricularia grisea]